MTDTERLALIKEAHRLLDNIEAAVAEIAKANPNYKK